MLYSNPPTKRVFLGDNYKEIVENTVSKMKDIIKESAKNPYVRRWTENIVRDVADRNQWGEVNTIYRFLQMNTRYTYDPKGIEYIQTPDYVLRRIEIGEKPSLDCDDLSVLSLSMLRSIGYPVALRLASYRPNKKFTHVYGLVKIEDDWIVFDAVRKDKKLGWESPGITAVKDYKI